MDDLIAEGWKVARKCCFASSHVGRGYYSRTGADVKGEDMYR
jgi:hypothetical protein